jgi:putative nucleotidyltransferase with HDIG domain
VLQRFRQFRESSRLPAARDYEVARRILAPPLFALFEAQHPRDIVHSARTADWLLVRGVQDIDLLAAALLHDIGKGEQRRRDRVAFVLAHRARADRLLAARRSRFEVRRALARSRSHSEEGARALERAGATPRVVELTRLHHALPKGDVMLALLQQADSET